MVLLGYEAQPDAHFGPFRDSANLDTRSVHCLRRTYHRDMWNLVSFHLETVLVSVQDRCMVCAKCAIGS
jgi:delta-aminolevulinic acid dehydratase/porphobilinogen synthase